MTRSEAEKLIKTYCAPYPFLDEFLNDLFQTKDKATNIELPLSRNETMEKYLDYIRLFHSTDI